jgi:hypothetical protein
VHLEEDGGCGGQWFTVEDFLIDRVWKKI